MHLGHIGIITATDQQSAEVAGFFSDVLQLPVSGEPDQGYAEVDAGGPTIAIHRGLMLDELVTPHGGTLLELTTTDVRGDIEGVRARRRHRA